MSTIKTGQQPCQSFVICSLPRSGSTMLALALEDTAVAGRPLEYLCPRKEGHYANEWLLPKNYTLLSFMESMITHSMTANRIWGVKIHYFDFVRFLERAREEFQGTQAEGELLDQCFPGARYIFIRREDRVRQAISLLRAVDSMQWQRLPSEPVSERMQRLKINIERISPLADMFSDMENQWRDFFARNNLFAYEVVYEDMIRSYEETVLGVLDHLDVTVPARFEIRPPGIIRQSDLLTEVAVARYMEQVAAAPGPELS